LLVCQFTYKALKHSDAGIQHVTAPGMYTAAATMQLTAAHLPSML
jgi:hypothetical protein